MTPLTRFEHIALVMQELGEYEIPDMIRQYGELYRFNDAFFLFVSERLQAF